MGVDWKPGVSLFTLTIAQLTEVEMTMFSLWDGLFLLERIAVGSFSGILRIYNPHHDGEGFKPEQVLLEQNLGMPILQLACGKFVA